MFCTGGQKGVALAHRVWAEGGKESNFSAGYTAQSGQAPQCSLPSQGSLSWDGTHPELLCQAA